MFADGSHYIVPLDPGAVERGHRTSNVLPTEVSNVRFAAWRHRLCLGGAPQLFEGEVADRVRAGDLVVDIGAHGGDSALPLGYASGPFGLCIAFEPNWPAFDVLSYNASINRSTMSIWPVQRAVMPAAGTYTFHYTDSEGGVNGGFALGTAAGIGVTGHHVPKQVEAVRLDEWLLANVPDALPRWSFCKIDAEGADASLLESHADFFRQWRPVIQTECYPGLNTSERRHWWDVIQQTLNYVPTVNCERLLTWEEVEAATGVIDAIALPDAGDA